MKKGKDLKVGDLVPIYYDPFQVMLSSPPTPKPFIDKVAVITEICGYKTSVLVDGKLESWDIADLKKMAAHKTAREMYNEV
jgi:hypothetical protein